MRPNFDTCGALFTASNESFPEFTYNGSVPSLFSHTGRPKLITYEGCQHLCGSGIAYYHWTNSSQTITTWVLPIISVVVQAPYESNEFIKTLFALARWIGSPMATLAYTLWNIKVTGKCALMVDMATKYGIIPRQESAFGRIRDSFYILSVMNQCMFNHLLCSLCNRRSDIQDRMTSELVGVLQTRSRKECPPSRLRNYSE